MTLRPFISYAREDLTVATKLYEDLRALGAEPWLDKKKLVGGQNWQVAIRKAIRECSHFIALLSSNSLSKRGFVQKELRDAISILEEFPPDDIFVIPVRLEDVEPIQEALRNLHRIDLFPSYDAGLEELAKSLRQTPTEMPRRTAPTTPPNRIVRSKASLFRLIIGTAIALVTALFLIVNVMSRYIVPRWNDQYNCGQDEHWVGMTPNTVERSFEVTAEQAKHAVFHGELRWSPMINHARQTTIGKVELEIDDRHYVIYNWNTPATSTYTFDIAISHLLVGSSGRFKIRWRWEDGSSGICVVRSNVVFPRT